MADVLHDAGAASHATAPPAAATAAGASENYRQIAASEGGGGNGASAASASLLLGSVPSIPSRFETVLYAGDQEPDAFNSRVARFRTVAQDLPGPGSYAGDLVAAGGFGESGGPGGALKLASSSWSTKGLGVGFVSKAARFKRKGGGPSPATYDPHARTTLAARASSAPSRGGFSSALGGTSAFRPAQSAALNPALSHAAQSNNNPGPGHYQQTKVVVLAGREQRKLAAKAAAAAGAGDSASSLAAHFQSQSLALLSPEPAFNTRDARFRGGIGGQTRGVSRAAPGSYDPYGPTGPQPSAKASHATFKSQTERTDFTHTGNTAVPGPGAYTKPLTEEKSNAGGDDAAGALSPSRSFKSTGLDRFGNPKERRIPVELLPGPGAYDPYIPGARADSPTRGGPSVGLRVSAKHPPPVLTSPLAASQSHGLPVRSAAGGYDLGSSPEARLGGMAQAEAAAAASASTKRKKRAAGVGGPGKSLLATRGGPGVALNSPALLLHPSPGSGTFGRAGVTAPAPLPALSSPLASSALALSQQAPPPAEGKAPGPAFYNSNQAFHAVADKKAFHLNTEHRWV